MIFHVQKENMMFLHEKTRPEKNIILPVGAEADISLITQNFWDISLITKQQPIIYNTFFSTSE